VTGTYHCPSKSEHSKHLFPAPPVCCRDMDPARRKMPGSSGASTCQILSIIWWQDHVRNIEVTNQTGLPSVIEHIVKRRNSYFRTHCQDTILSQPTRLCIVKSCCHSADYPTRRGSVVQVAPTSDGWIRFATTTTAHLLTCEEMLSDEVRRSFRSDATVQ